MNRGLRSDRGARTPLRTPRHQAFRADLPCADRPFSYLIRDVDNGTILFLGRVMKPKL